LAQNKGKNSFGLGKKSPKFKKYINLNPFKPHFKYRTVHMTVKMRCDAAMVLAKLYTAPHHIASHM